MGLFRRRKVEEINLEIKETRNKEIDEKFLYSEKKEIEVDGFSSLPGENKKKYLDKSFNAIQKKNYDIINSYYLCKIFAKVALKDKDFNQEMMRLDKNINRVRKEFADLQKKVNEVKFNEETNDELLNSTYEKHNAIAAFQKVIAENIEVVRKKYFNYLKIATVNVCLNKSNTELETLNTNLNKFLEEFKNLNVAAEYIYYNSGMLIVQMINALLKMINKQGNEDYIKTYDFNYFLKSDVIITLEVTEWIDLYNKVKFVTREVNKNKEMADVFSQFEIRYLILMMYLEVNKKTDFKI